MIYRPFVYILLVNEKQTRNWFYFLLVCTLSPITRVKADVSLDFLFTFQLPFPLQDYTTLLSLGMHSKRKKMEDWDSLWDLFTVRKNCWVGNWSYLFERKENLEIAKGILTIARQKVFPLEDTRKCQKSLTKWYSSLLRFPSISTSF